MPKSAIYLDTVETWRAGLLVKWPMTLHCRWINNLHMIAPSLWWELVLVAPSHQLVIIIVVLLNRRVGPRADHPHKHTQYYTINKPIKYIYNNKIIYTTANITLVYIICIYNILYYYYNIRRYKKRGEEWWSCDDAVWGVLQRVRVYIWKSPGEESAPSPRADRGRSPWTSAEPSIIFLYTQTLCRRRTHARVHIILCK